MPPYCPISSTVTYTFTTPTHPNLPSHTSTPSTTPDSFWPTFATIGAHTFLSRMHFLYLKALAPSMNNTLATNTRANGTLSHEPKTHSPPPPPPSLPSRQAAHAIQSSPPALSPPPLQPTAPASPSYAHREQDLVALLNSRRCPMRSRDTSTTAFPYVHSRLSLGTFHTSHLEIEAHAWPLAVPGRDRYAAFPPRANTLDVPRAQEIQVQRPFPYVHSRLPLGTFSHFAP